MDAELLPSLSRPASGRPGLTQYLARYFSLSPADSITALPPVLIFIDAVGTISDPKANEISRRQRVVFLRNSGLAGFSAALWRQPDLAIELHLWGSAETGCRETAASRRPG
jgi:hypothetical protein